MPLNQIPVLHVVTNDAVVVRPDFQRNARQVMAALGERGALHLRAHGVSGKLLYDLAAALSPEQAATGCWLVLNDRVDIARVVGARGIQLGWRSFPIADARVALNESNHEGARNHPTAMGVSVHDLGEAVTAQADGADWMVAGPVFATASHPAEPGRGVRLIEEITHAVRVPVIAIGGILPEHVRPLRRAGAHGVAAIAGVWDSENAERAVIRYLSEYDADGGR